MTSLPRLLSVAGLTAGALALPAVAGAAQTVGSSLDTTRGPLTTLSCGGCSFAIDQIDGLQTWTDPGVVTAFTAKLDAGATARLRTFARADGDGFVPVRTSGPVTGTGDVATYAVSVPVAANATIGLALSGGIAAIEGTGRIGVGDGDADPSRAQDVEPLLSAQVESDHDEDGLGDETQDPCVFCAADAPGGGTGGGTSTGPGREVLPAGDDSPGATAGKGGSFRSNDRIRSRTTFTIQDTGVVVAGRKPVVTAYVFNGHNDAMTGSATLQVGGKAVAKARVWVSTQDDVAFKVTPKVAKRIVKGARAVVSATVSSDEDGTERDSTPVAFAHPVTTAFDGEYRAKGPLVIKVAHGVVTTASTSLFLTATKGGAGSMTRAFALPSGLPAIIGRDGKVEAHGHFGSDETRFRAAFRRNGTARGYLSQWYYQLGVSSSGRFESTPFLGASNWTAKKR